MIIKVSFLISWGSLNWNNRIFKIWSQCIRTLFKQFTFCSQIIRIIFLIFTFPYSHCCTLISKFVNICAALILAIFESKFLYAYYSKWKVFITCQTQLCKLFVCSKWSNFTIFINFAYTLTPSLSCIIILKLEFNICQHLLKINIIFFN